MAEVLGAQHGSRLLPELGTWQILAITISGTIGIGFGTNTGEVLAISGPGGVLLAFGVVGAVAIAVMEGICEMIVLWPISNAMIEFVRAFVDRDLAIVVGIAYWYTYATTLAALIIGSADLLKFWDISFPLLNVTFALFIGAIFIINSRGIWVFGLIELFGGIIKILVLLVIFVVMICINYGTIGNGPRIGSTFFNDGVRSNPNVASSHFESVLISIPLAIFSYIGVELVTVTAFEAANPSRLKVPAKHIAYIITATYLITIGGFVANIEWFNQHLPQFFSQSLVSLDDPNLGHTPYDWPDYSGSTAAPVIAALQAGISVLPGLFTGFLVYSGLSSANTNLYVASRTLYGLTRDLSQTKGSWLSKLFANLNTVSHTTHIPVWAIIISCLTFSCWLPFVHLRSNFTQEELQETLVAIGSVGCVLVWASQCLAFIRYHWWLSMHRDELRGPTLEKFQRWPMSGFSSYMSSIQPVPAYLGLFSCLLIVLILNMVSMLNGVDLKFKALRIYLGPGLLLIIFIGLKIRNRRWWVRLGDWDQLRNTLSDLDALIEPDRRPQPAPRRRPRISEPEPYRPEAPYPPPDQFEAAQQHGGVEAQDFILPPSAQEAAVLHGVDAPRMPHHQLSDESFQSRHSPFQNQDMSGYPLNEMNAEPLLSPATEMYTNSGGHDRRVSAVSAQSDVRSPPAAYTGPRYQTYHESEHTEY